MLVGPRLPLTLEAARELLGAAGVRAVVLVEGWSDQAALESLARRRGWDLAAERIGIVPIGGITNIRKFGESLGPLGLGLQLAGLCDAGEEAQVWRSLPRMGFRTVSTRDEAEQLGFFACEADLEDELIRALGPEVVKGRAAPTLHGHPSSTKDSLWHGLGRGAATRRRLGASLSSKVTSQGEVGV